MKTLLSLLVAICASVSIAAQTVTILVKGTRNKQVIVDGQYYTVNTDINTATGNQPIVLTNLSVGQHTLGIVRSNTSTVSNKNFYLRSGYDLELVVNSNGAVTTRESIAKKTITGSGYMIAMTDADFNILYDEVIDERRTSQRNILVTDAFENEDYYFTTAQARQLIQLVNSQAYRLRLAKAAYPKVTDPANFSRMYDLLNTRAGRIELENYVANYNLTNPGGQTGTTGVAMTEGKYNILLQQAQNQWSGSARLNYILAAFNNTNNYFTTTQARQLILLMNAESDRLQLAKAVYRGIVDPQNFSVISNLLSSQAARNELAMHISASGNTGMAMTSSQFNIIYRDAQNQYNVSQRVTYLSNVFSNTANFYTVDQAKQLIQLVSDESNRLYLAKLAYRGITDKTNFTRMNDVLYSQTSRDALAAHVRNFDTGGTTVYTRVAMTDSEYNTLYRGVANTWGLGAKMSRLTEIFNNATYNFSTLQAEALIKLVSSESNRLALAKASYDNIVDPLNFNQLYDVLETQASRDELNLFVQNNSNTNTGYGIRNPMSESQYNTLYNDVANRWGLGVKMQALTDIFNTGSYFFTTSQAKRLVELVSSETNRLQLAKSSYDNITDPENFALMYDVLASQSSKNDLATYVQTYSSR